MARIKELDRSSKGKRQRRPVIYLVCEGKETEIRYFKHFRTRNSGIDIIPVTSKQKSAVGLVRKAEKTLGDKDFFPDLGDKLWCVFDCDAVIDVLEKQTKLKNYRKSQDVYEILQPLMQSALERVAKRTNKLQREKTELISRESNPFTNVNFLVKYLIEKR